MSSSETLTGRGRPTLRLPTSLIGEERLARMAARGEQRAFEALFARYHRELHCYCSAILGEPDEANDALQNTMAIALRHLPKAEKRTSLRGWLYRVAHNESVSILRRRTVPLDPLRLPDGVAPAADVRAEERERLRQLVADLNALPDRQRGALLMRELSGLSYSQIAAAMATSKGAARQLVYEAREALRAAERGRDLSADLTALYPPLAPAGASGILASLLGTLGEGGATGAGAVGGGAALGGAGMKAASIASVVVLGAGPAGVAGGLEPPFETGGGTQPAGAARTGEPSATHPSSARSVAGRGAPSHARSRSAAQPTPRQATAGRGKPSHAAAAAKGPGAPSARSHGGDPPATPPGASHSSSSAAQPASSGPVGEPAPAADQGLAQAEHDNSAASPAQTAVPSSNAGGIANPPGKSSDKP